MLSFTRRWQVFEVMDKDASGSIELHEFQQHVEGARAFASAFGCPAESDQVIQPTAIGAEPSVAAVFESIDLDGDGKVSKSEFKKAFQGNRKDVMNTLMIDVGVSWDEVSLLYWCSKRMLQLFTL